MIRLPKQTKEAEQMVPMPPTGARHPRLSVRWGLAVAVCLAAASAYSPRFALSGADVAPPRLVRAEVDAAGLRAHGLAAVALPRSFAGHAGYQSELAAASAEAGPQRLAAAVVCGGWFRAAGVDAALGRVLGPNDDRADAAPALVLSEEAWRERFGADPSVLGSAVRLNGRTFTVVGVAAAPRSAGPGAAQLGWVSARAWAQVEGGAYVRLDGESEPGTG